MPHHILLTGAAGRIGAHVLVYLLSKGYTITALDLVPLPLQVTSRIPTAIHSALKAAVCDLTDYHALEEVFTTSSTPITAIVHLGAIPNPLRNDGRTVHNNNVVSSYNVLRTGSDHGVRRIVQASSVNAPGLSFPPEGHQKFDELPVTEETPMRPVSERDDWLRRDTDIAIGGPICHIQGVSASILVTTDASVCELQATAMTRFTPGLRIASLRFHLCELSYTTAVPLTLVRDVFCWTSFDACASACELGLTSEGWEGHEVFNIVAPEICWEGGVKTEEQSKVVKEEKVGSLELIEEHWRGRYNGLREGWWDGRPRRSFWDSTKAERVLGWRHDES